MYGGDFNVVRHLCERVGDTKQSQAMVDFFEFIFV
jgi:hypothetical protein